MHCGWEINYSEDVLYAEAAKVNPQHHQMSRYLTCQIQIRVAEWKKDSAGSDPRSLKSHTERTFQWHSHRNQVFFDSVWWPIGSPDAEGIIFLYQFPCLGWLFLAEGLEESTVINKPMALKVTSKKQLVTVIGLNPTVSSSNYLYGVLNGVNEELLICSVILCC